MVDFRRAGHILFDIDLLADQNHCESVMPFFLGRIKKLDIKVTNWLLRTKLVYTCIWTNEQYVNNDFISRGQADESPYGKLNNEGDYAIWDNLR